MIHGAICSATAHATYLTMQQHTLVNASVCTHVTAVACYIASSALERPATIQLITARAALGQTVYIIPVIYLAMSAFEWLHIH